MVSWYIRQEGAKKSNAVKRTARSYAREEGAVDILLKKWLLDKRQSLRKKRIERREQNRKERLQKRAEAKVQKKLDRKAAAEKRKAERQAAIQKRIAQKKAAEEIRAVAEAAIHNEQSKFCLLWYDDRWHLRWKTVPDSGYLRDSALLKRKRVVKKSSNDELGLSSKEFNARYRKKQKEEQTKRNTVWWRLKSLQTVMKDHIVAQTFEAGLSLTALNRQILFAILTALS